MTEILPMVSGPVVTLLPATAEHLGAIEAGQLPEGLTFADGFPHADTLDGLQVGLGWLVVVDGVVVGDCGMHGPGDDPGIVEIGYGLAEPQRGRGYGSEAVRLLSDWLLDQPGVRAVVAEVDPDNVPSRRVLEKNGFQREAAGPGGVLFRRSR
ncbi:hypothetical protein acdb102_31950 [Acidothermaceae bacterium B102]|nr:hypothetical protein acdb102_31950 [Acidothermaceae bacterium B102]